MSCFIVNLITPKSGARHELLFNKHGQVCLTSMSDLSVTKIIPLIIINLAPKARAKQELLFNEQGQVCWTSKSDLSSKTKCDQNYISWTYKFDNT